jgi:hypothetical protein
MRPAAEWRVIDGEPATVQSLYLSYILILAAIPPIAYAIGALVFGYSVFGFTYRPPASTVITTAVLQYVLSLASIYVLALIVDALATSFGGRKNQVQALKVCAYSWTAAWLAGVFAVVPALAILSIVGLYSLYLLYLGLPVLMKSPPDKAVGYVVVVILAAIVVWFLVGVIVTALVGAFGIGGPMPVPGVR